MGSFKVFRDELVHVATPSMDHCAATDTESHSIADHNALSLKPAADSTEQLTTPHTHPEWSDPDSALAVVSARRQGLRPSTVLLKRSMSLPCQKHWTAFTDPAIHMQSISMPLLSDALLNKGLDLASTAHVRPTQTCIKSLLSLASNSTTASDPITIPHSSPKRNFGDVQQSLESSPCIGSTPLAASWTLSICRHPYTPTQPSVTSNANLTQPASLSLIPHTTSLSTPLASQPSKSSSSSTISNPESTSLVVHLTTSNEAYPTPLKLQPELITDGLAAHHSNKENWDAIRKVYSTDRTRSRRVKIKASFQHSSDNKNLGNVDRVPLADITRRMQASRYTGSSDYTTFSMDEYDNGVVAYNSNAENVHCGHGNTNPFQVSSQSSTLKVATEPNHQDSICPPVHLPLKSNPAISTASAPPQKQTVSRLVRASAGQTTRQPLLKNAVHVHKSFQVTKEGEDTTKRLHPSNEALGKPKPARKPKPISALRSMR
ncbi:hypothetical protein BDV3_001061 [Batrachochytrium dendrobatidis]|nr:hypothetical protein BDEG_20599 [Batrachochytrium dendrobatidis JEL423]